MDCSLPASSIRGILQSGILEWVAFPSTGDLPHMDQTCVSCIAGRFITIYVTREAQSSPVLYFHQLFKFYKCNLFYWAGQNSSCCFWVGHLIGAIIFYSHYSDQQLKYLLIQEIIWSIHTVFDKNNFLFILTYNF